MCVYMCFCLCECVFIKDVYNQLANKLFSHLSYLCRYYVESNK